VLRINLWPVGDRLFGAPSKSAPGSRTHRSGDGIPVSARFSELVNTGPWAHPASYKMGTGSFPGVESGRDVTLTPQPLLLPKSKNSIAILLLSLRALVACRKGETYLPSTKGCSVSAVLCHHQVCINPNHKD
jgi:hypothetical protein